MIIFDPFIVSKNDLFRIIDDIKANRFIVFSIISYITGFIFFPISRFFYDIIGCKIIGAEKLYDSHEEIAYRLAQIKQYSERNYAAIATYDALKAMSQSISLGLLFLTTISLVKGFTLHSWFWIITGCVLIFVSYLLLLAARVYQKYRMCDIESAMKLINNSNLKQPLK